MKTQRKKTSGSRHAILAEVKFRREALKTLILADPKLGKDLEFVANILGRSIDQVIQSLNRDVARFSSEFSALRLEGGCKDYNDDRYFWTVMPKHATDLAAEIERVNRSELSPANDAALMARSRDKGNRKAKALYKELPELLRSFAQELRHNVKDTETRLSSQRAFAPWINKIGINMTLEERVFAKTQKYHQAPLYRLRKAVAELLGYDLITERAYRIRLNRQRKTMRDWQDPMPVIHLPRLL